MNIDNDSKEMLLLSTSKDTLPAFLLNNFSKHYRSVSRRRRIIVLAVAIVIGFIFFRSTLRVHPHYRKITKVTQFTSSGTYVAGHKSSHDLYLRAIETHKNHAAFHGYRQVISNASFTDDGIPNAYNKIILLLRVLISELEADVTQRARWIL